MNKKPFVINLKSGEEQTAIQLAQKLNSLKGVLNPDVLDGELLSKSEFEDFKNSVTKGIQGTEDRINYNNRNGRKTLSDMRWHGGGGGGSSNLLVQSVNGFAGNVNNNILALSTTNSNGSVLFALNGALAQDNTNFFWDNVAKQLSIGGISPIDGGDAQFPLSVLGNTNDFIAASLQNLSTGDSASTDFSVSADNDNTTIIGHYTDMGIWGSGFSFSAVGQVKTISLNAGGTGYTVNDVLNIVNGDSNAQATVLTVNGSGVILTILLTDNGTGYSTGNGYSTTGGTGTGGKINVLSLIDNSIYVANDGYVYCSGGNLVVSTDGLGKEVIFAVGGSGTTNEMGRFTATQFKVGKTGTTLGSIFFSGNTSTGITLQGQAVGASGVLTLPAVTGTLATINVAQTFTNTQTFTNAVNYTNDAITASGNAATIPVTARVHTVTNNSAATLTITLTTTSAVDGQLQLVRVLDFSGVAQTITWVNTENSTVTAPTTSNGSTTLPVTVGFQYNGLTSKWRTIASS